MNNPFINAQTLLNEILLKEPFATGFTEKILHPERIIEVSLPIKMDDGTTQVFTGYRSQHSDARGPYKWGIRYHEQVTKEEVMALSTWMSIKTSAVDLPLGGGKWGIIVNPKLLSERELESLSRAYVRAIHRNIGADLDVPAPDVNTNVKIMAWMLDEYQRVSNSRDKWVFTGKPVSYGGSLGRDIATALGGIYVLEEVLKSQKKVISGNTFAITGAGNAGLNAALLIKERWGIVVAMSDSSGAIYDPKGLDLVKISEVKAAKKGLASLGVKIISLDELLALDIFCIIPAALESQITVDNAGSINAEVILELANGPVTPEAEEILNSRSKKCTIIPDILANAGGVTVSYYEQVQNATNYYWPKEEVFAKLLKQMSHATKEILDYAEQKKYDLRTSAYILSLRRIEAALIAKGAIG